MLDILVGFARPLPPPFPPSASPPAPRGLRGLRPRGQEAAPKARLAVLIGEHVAAHEAGSASVPGARGLVYESSVSGSVPGGSPTAAPAPPLPATALVSGGAGGSMSSMVKSVGAAGS